MSLRESTLSLKTGITAPDFSLPDANGQIFSLEELRGTRATLIAFWCNHCPYVIHVREAMNNLFQEYEPQGFSFIAINSNDFEAYPADAPAKMLEESHRYSFRFPYLVDETQVVAKVYKAACTPDFFLFDAELQLTYTGQFDSTRPNGNPAHGSDLRKAIECTLHQRRITEPVFPSAGCNIKWKPGQEPDYF